MASHETVAATKEAAEIGYLGYADTSLEGQSEPPHQLLLFLELDWRREQGVAARRRRQLVWFGGDGAWGRAGTTARGADRRRAGGLIERRVPGNTPRDREAAAMDGAVAALSGIAAIVAIALLADLGRPSTIAALAAGGVVIEAVRGGGASVGTVAVPHLPLLLFLLAEGATYRLIDARWGIECANLRRFVLGTLVWAAAAHLLWIDALFALRAADTVEPWLPLATGAVQLLFILGIPLAVALVRGRLALTGLYCDPATLEQPAARIEVFRGPAGGRRTAWIICYAGVSDQPRIIRQGRALVDDGWRVVVCGFDGHSPRPADWTYIRLPSTDAFSSLCFRTLIRARRVCQLIAACGCNRRGQPWFGWAGRLYQALHPHWLYLGSQLSKVLRDNPDLRPDLIIAHNYHTADLGYRLAARCRAKFSVDCHEYAGEEYSSDPQWVRWRRPCIVAVEEHYLSRADVVTTVCDGIAELLDRDYRLPQRTVVVRSVPLKNIQQFRPVGDRITVLYHGEISRGRELHVAIRSVALWRPEFDFVVRGRGDDQYIAELHDLANRLGVAGRVIFEPAVPFDRIVPEANKADIGFYSYLSYSPEIEFSLPNKFFEYVMAGLAICVGNLAEVARLTRQFDLGKLIPEHSPEGVAAAINSFTREEIVRFKRASLKAAETLNWDRERHRLIGAYNGLFAVPAPAAAADTAEAGGHGEAAAAPAATAAIGR